MDNNAPLSVLTWNVRGIISSCKILNNLLDTYPCDVAVLCEHKLTLQSYSFLESMHMKYLPIPCVVNNESNFINYVTPPVVSFLVRKDIIYSTTEIQNINCNRIVGIELKGKDINVLPCYIFGVYLPADGDLIFYNECVDKLFDLYSYYSEFGRVIIAGDLNARYKFKPNSYVQEQKSKNIN